MAGVHAKNFPCAIGGGCAFGTELLSPDGCRLDHVIFGPRSSSLTKSCRTRISSRRCDTGGAIRHRRMLVS